MSFTPGQLEAIARNITAHGTGPANVARVAKLFGVADSSLAEAIKLGNNAAKTSTVTEAVPVTAPSAAAAHSVPRVLEFKNEVDRIDGLPMASLNAGELATLVAARMTR
jgi:transposase-like protein